MINLKHVLNVVCGDLWPLLKDRAYLRKFVVLPLILIPMALLATPLVIRESAKGTATSAAVLAVDRAHPLPPELRQVLERGLPSARGFVIEPVADPVAYVRDRRAPIGLRYTPEKVEIIARQTTIANAGMVRRLATLLSYYQAARLAKLGAGKAAAALKQQVAVVNAATPAEKALGGMAFLIPLIVIMWLLNAVESTALEISAEERDRGLIEALLLTPVSRESVALGKVLAAGAVGAAASLAAWAGVVLAGALGRFFPDDGTTFSDIGMPIGGQIVLTPWSTFAFLATLIALGLLLSAFILSLGFASPTARDARSKLTVLGTALIFAGLALQFSDSLSTLSWVYAVPAFNAVIALLEAAKGTLTPIRLALSVAVNLALAGLFAYRAARAITGARSGAVAVQGRKKGIAG